ncbi:MAG: hypothetical protein J5I50_06255 [Chitinophagaceae bacterium]|nr:hypothetical protein [Chitinophagaceae bacterium]
MNTEANILSLYELRSLTASEFNELPEKQRLDTMQNFFGPKMQTRAAMAFFQNKSIILVSERKQIVYAAAIEQAEEISASIAAKGTGYVCHFQNLVSVWDN